MFSSLISTLLFISVSIAAQETATVVCVAGQCVQGFTNLTIGAKLSAPGAATDVFLLPGQYTSTTNPQLLHNILTTPGASLIPSPGFPSVSSVSLPLNLTLEPGVVVYSNSLYGGQASFAPLPSTPSNSSTSVSAGSLALSSNVWLSVLSGSSNRFILWSSVPDVTQLPSSIASSTLGLVDIQSASCSPPCSGNGVCSASGTCQCPTGFTGSSCETCAAGFFGSTCQACPSGCGKCDEGISGTGRCLTQVVANPSSGCNCLNGVCQSNGQCVCNAGWTTASNGTSCAKCASGFYLTSDGNCQVCQLGCSECADSSGVCITCQSGFTQDANDRTKCIANKATTSSGTTCPDGSFSNGTSCAPCSTSCTTCSGPTSNDCIICGSGTYKLNGTCVSTDGNGVCANSNLIADNNKHECDTCPFKCTSCKIPNFTVASTVNQLQCTGCLPGYVLSNGQCVQSCSTGTFLNPSDNITCTACDSACSTCVGASNFCLTCANNQLASGGSCVSSCPSNTFSSSGVCIACHPDCETCSGGSFNQCSSCPSNRPVLTNGRCLPTCSQSQYFDTTSSSCKSCDSSCSSCIGGGSGQCLACSDSTKVLQSGTCVSSKCNSSTSIVQGLGVCFSDLVLSPASGTSSSSGSLPTITGLSNPVPVTKSGGTRLTWWQILLMALGCAFIFLVFLMCWRKSMRKKRAKQTQHFAQAKQLDTKDWRWKLMRFGEKLFGHSKSTSVPMTKASKRSDEIGLRDVEAQWRHTNAKKDGEFDNIIGAYDYSIRSPASEYSRYYRRQPHNNLQHSETARESMTTQSIYSQVTGVRNNTMPEPRQPVKGNRLMSRFSASTASTDPAAKQEQLPALPQFASSRPPTPAQEYKTSVLKREDPSEDSRWMLEPDNTGFSSESKNPFIRRQF